MGLIKLAAPGPGFAALERIGLASKALQTHAGSDWLKNAAPKIAQVQKAIAPKVPVNGLPLVGMKELNRFGPVNPWSKR
jgi:hypothetical protein